MIPNSQSIPFSSLHLPVRLRFINRPRFKLDVNKVTNDFTRSYFVLRNHRYNSTFRSTTIHIFISNYPSFSACHEADPKQCKHSSARNQAIYQAISAFRAPRYRISPHSIFFTSDHILPRHQVFESMPCPGKAAIACIS